MYRDFDTLKENVLADVIPAVSSRFGDAGMLDSSMAADTISRSAASAIAPIEYGAWENAQNRALSAYGQAAPMEQGAYESARGRQMQALGLTPELMGARYTDPMMALQAGRGSDQFGLQNRSQILSALGLAPELSSARYMDPQMLGMRGQAYDQYTQSLLDAGMGQWYEEANRPYDELQRAASLGLGFGGMGGQTSQTQGQDQGFMGTVGGIMQTLSPLLFLLS